MKIYDIIITMLTLYDLGAVDGTHIPISQPRRNLMAYTTRKAYTAVTLQAVCTNNLKFIDVSAGWPGSIHDARIFRLSSLSGGLAEKLNNTDYFLIGDCAYPLQKHLMKPSINNGHLTEVFHFCKYYDLLYITLKIFTFQAQRQFNHHLCSSRSRI